jgi:hypothetical protein
VSTYLFRTWEGFILFITNFEKYLISVYQGVSKSFRTGLLERGLQMVQTTLWHYIQLYRYFVSQSSKFYRHKPFCCFSTSACLFCHRLSPETFGYTLLLKMSQDSSVGIATSYGMDDRMIGFRFPARAGNFSLRHHVQTSYGAHPASYPMGTGSPFRGGKVAVAWNWPLTSI